MVKPFNITVIQAYVPTSNAKEAEVEQFCEDLLELTPQKDVLFIIRDWNAKVGSQETPGLTGKLMWVYVCALLICKMKYFNKVPFS